MGLKSLPFLQGILPECIAARWAHRRGCIFFDTARSLAGSEALSIVAVEPSLTVAGRTAEEWEAFRSDLAARQQAADSATPPGAGMPDGFAAGWIEYDGAFSFGFYDEVLIYQHATGAWYGSGDPETIRQRWEGELSPPLSEGEAPLCFASECPREAYLSAVKRAQAYIAAGDIYQVNLTHRFSAAWNGAAPFAFYQWLRRISPSPQAAYMALKPGAGHLEGERSVLSSSPELFLKISGRQITTRPIKGTRPRGHDPASDARHVEELTSSAKETAELVMITDLLRNDLGQVCEYGSVRVPGLLQLETHEQVFHLVSTVEGELRQGVDAPTALRACFPGGSITGAPKKRAREVIAELEQTPRGLYTGAIGYFGFNGESQFNIAIRTVIVEGEEAHFHVGAGIVADSHPAAEWQETLDKAAGILLAAEAWNRARGHIP